MSQSTDRLERMGQPPLVSLETTELYGAGGGTEGSELGYEMEAKIGRLPCASRDYRFVATTAAIDESRADATEASVYVVSVHLPRGIRCGAGLPGDVEGGTKVRLEPSSDRSGSPTVYAGGGIHVESLRSCATLEYLCPGRYLLLVRLHIKGRVLTLVYDIVVKSSRPSH